MYADKVRESLSARMEREKLEFQQAMQDIGNAQNGEQKGESEGDNQKQLLELMMGEEGGEEGSELNFQLTMGGDAISIPDHLLHDKAGSATANL